MTQPFPTDITFQEYLTCTSLSQSWAQSYDTKNWSLLSSITTPILYIDYTSVMGPERCFPSMPAADYIAMMSAPRGLGDPLVATQHLLGVPVLTRTAADEITGTYQLRAHHVRFRSNGQGDSDGFAKGVGRKVLVTATGHAVIKHFYKRTADGWKLAGLRPTVLFDEGNVKALFSFKEAASGSHCY